MHPRSSLGRLRAVRREVSVVLRFGPIRARASHPLREVFADITADRLRVATAFCTEAGVEDLRSHIITPSDFDAIDKEWLVGIQNGITQPDGLRRLANAQNSSARIPFGTETLASQALRASTFFHPKIYCFENAAGNVRLVSTSANLTHGGLRSNGEQYLVWKGRKTDAEATTFDTWWRGLWSQADVATPQFVAAYEAQRPSVPSPPTVQATGPPVATLRAASSLWIELTRRGEGGSFNQIELLLNAHHFFYPDRANPPTNVHRSLTFEDAAENQYTAPGRRIMFNGPPLRTVGNHMWRIYAPTAAEGLSGYQDGDVFVRFQRTGSRDHYRLEMTPARSAGAARWISSASGIASRPGPPPRRMGWS